MFCQQILINVLQKNTAGENRFNVFPISIEFLEDLKYENVFLYDQNLSNMVVVLGWGPWRFYELLS